MIASHDIFLIDLSFSFFCCNVYFCVDSSVAAIQLTNYDNCCIINNKLFVGVRYIESFVEKEGKKWFNEGKKTMFFLICLIFFRKQLACCVGVWSCRNRKNYC